jgi:hypothetical protein
MLFPTFDLTQTEVERITEVYNSIKASYPEAGFNPDFQPQLSNYEAVRGSYTSVECGPALCLDESAGASNPGKYLCFVKLAYHIGGGGYIPSGPSWDTQTWGFAVLRQKYGHVLIRPETALDKIRELLHHAELHFEDDKAFSRQFYVLANEEEKARMLLGPALRGAIMSLRLRDFVIEVIDNLMIIGDNKSVDPATAAEIAAFLYRLSPTC